MYNRLQFFGEKKGVHLCIELHADSTQKQLEI
jgi:hypothetical protein